MATSQLVKKKKKKKKMIPPWLHLWKSIPTSCSDLEAEEATRSASGRSLSILSQMHRSPGALNNYGPTQTDCNHSQADW